MSNITSQRLGQIADVRVSGVDKKSYEGEPAVRLCNYTDVYYNDNIVDTLTLMDATASLSQIERLKVQPGDVIVTKDSETADDIGIPAYVQSIGDDVVCGYHLAIIRPDFQRVHPRYLFWQMKSGNVAAQWEGLAKGVTRVSLPTYAMKSLVLEGPADLAVQAAIADFLDSETAKIDAMIKKQRALIDGLRMRKESTVRDALSAPIADSDARVIPHLGAVPNSWAVRPLWSLYRRGKRTGYTDEPMVSVFREHGVVYKDDHANLNVTAEDRSIYQLVEPGWLVVNRMKAWQGSVGVSALRGISSGHYLCFRPLEDLHHPFMNWLFRSPQYRDWFAAHSRGVRPGQAEIDNEHLKSAPVILPPHNVQQRIADHLDRETARIDVLITRSERLIELSHERRAALITSAVTGQIDIATDAMAMEGAA